MDAAQIAAKLTPSQLRVLRYYAARSDFHSCMLSRASASEASFVHRGVLEREPKTLTRHRLTPLGRAVLAALDAKEAGNE